MQFVFTGLRILLAMGVVVAIAVIALSSPKPHSRADISVYAKALFEFGAIDYVHALDSPRRDALQDLFDQVGMGQELTPEHSSEYRKTYAQILQDHAARFQAVDQDLSMALDFAMAAENNCGSFGIAGTHDLHDMSAKLNFIDLQTNLARLEAGVGFFTSVYLINDINKDLVDLIVHMAPAVHSIGVRDPDFIYEQGSAFDTMQAAFKTAQFAPVNSTAYWEALDAALMIYEQIVEDTQSRIETQSSNLERRIAGRWLALQTVAPRLDKNDDAYVARRAATRL